MNSLPENNFSVIKSLSLVLLLFFYKGAFCQKNVADSLLSELNKYEKKAIEEKRASVTIGDTIKIKILNGISYAYVYTETSQARQFARKAINLVTDLEENYKSSYGKNLAKWRSASYTNLANSFYFDKRIDSAKYFYSLAGEISKSCNDISGVARSFSLLGNIIAMEFNYNKAIEYYLKAANLYDSIHEYTFASVTYGNIGTLHCNLNNYKEALIYLNKALELLRKVKESDANYIYRDRYFPTHYNNIATIYIDMGSADSAMLYADSAIESKAGRIDPNILSTAYEKKGIAYYEKRDFDKAVFFLDKSYQNALQVYNLHTLYYCLNNLAASNFELYVISKDKSKLKIGRDHLSALKSLIDTTEADLKARADYFRNMALYDSLTGDFKTALLHLQSFNKLQDSIFNTEQKDEVTRISLYDEFSKKELAVQAEQEKKSIVNKQVLNRQRLLMYFSISALLFIVMFSIKIRRRIRENKKINDLLSETNEELNNSIDELNSTQQQILKNERMAAFGLLAADMVKEISVPIQEVNAQSKLAADISGKVRDEVGKENESEILEQLGKQFENIVESGKKAQMIIGSHQIKKSSKKE